MLRMMSIAACMLASLQIAAAEPVGDTNKRSAFKRPLQIPFPTDAPFDPRIATLGKMLFFDPRLSKGQNMSCATCHNPSFGWETPVKKAIGSLNQPLKRHTPTILNVAWQQKFYWDGRATSLEEQAEGPLTDPFEMNNSFETLIERLGAVPMYRTWFNRLYPSRGISKQTILTTIATYERTVISGWAPFDRWVDGDETAISDSAKRGFSLFIGRAGCVTCHSGWNFTDGLFHDTGLASDDLGRGSLQPEDEAAQFSFKTPSLRNIALRAPYNHDGQTPDLKSVILHYAGGGINRPTNYLEEFAITQGEISDLISFLESLSDTDNDVPAPRTPAG